jgi:hypothetical protein
MRRRLRVLLVTAVVAAAATRVQAQSDVLYNRPGSGARAAGMANAFIGISDDGTAASWNPAGLGQLRKPEISLVTNTTHRSARSEGFRNRDDSVSYTPMTATFLTSSLDFASLALPMTLAGKPVTVQGAWRRLYALDSRGNTQTTREPLADLTAIPTAVRFNNDVLGSIDLWSFAAAVKLTRRLAVGTSVNLWRGRWVEYTWISESPLAGGGAPLFADSRETTRLNGVNSSVGLMLTYPRWSVGLLHLSPMKSDISVVADLVSSGAGEAAAGIDGKVRFANSLGLGTAWRPAAHWTVAADALWDNWRAATIEAPNEPKRNLFDRLPIESTTTRNTISFNTGAERLFVREGYVVPLRFGAAWEPQGQRNPYTRDPINWVMLAAGTGYNTNTLKFDAALQYRWTSYRDGASFDVANSGRADLPTAVGERNLREWRAKVSVIVRISDTDKLRDTLGKILGGRP